MIILNSPWVKLGCNKMAKVLLLIMLCCIVLVSAENVGDSMELWKADCYDENSKLQQKIAENFLDLLQERFRSLPIKSSLLDIGCGTGRLIQVIQSKFPGIGIVGIDASKEMIEFANQCYADTNVSFHHDRAEELKTINTHSIDAVTSFSCLHWVHDQKAAFRAMYRVLKPGGWIGVMFAAETGVDDPIDQAYAQTIQEEPWSDYFKASKSSSDWNIVDSKIIKSQLEEIGFQIDFMGTQNFDFVFKDVNAFKMWILACFQQLKALSLELQLSCAQRIAELYLHSTADYQPKGPECAYRVDAFMVTAQKLGR
jgi:ubiquinone/menaquinone biosynthesis C-methylase UbiE